MDKFEEKIVEYRTSLLGIQNTLTQLQPGLIDALMKSKDNNEHHLNDFRLMNLLSLKQACQNCINEADALILLEKRPTLSFVKKFIKIQNEMKTQGFTQ